MPIDGRAGSISDRPGQARCSTAPWSVFFPRRVTAEWLWHVASVARRVRGNCRRLLRVAGVRDAGTVGVQHALGWLDRQYRIDHHCRPGAPAYSADRDPACSVVRDGRRHRPELRRQPAVSAPRPESGSRPLPRAQRCRISSLVCRFRDRGGDDQAAAPSERDSRVSASTDSSPG